MRIIVGLGNPGEKYERTRHNVGFMAIDALVASAGLSWEHSKKLNALIAKGSDTIYVKPQSFMNLSGQTVSTILNYYKLLPRQLMVFAKKNSDLSNTLTVLHDDLDVDFGKIKVTTDSRSAGHNGVQSIIDHLKTQKFKRIRIGVRNAALTQIQEHSSDRKNSISGFVLQKFSDKEQQELSKIISEIAIATR